MKSLESIAFRAECDTIFMSKEKRYHISYFIIKRNLFTVPQQEVLGEYEKIDEFMENLEKSGVYQIIKNVNQKKNLCKQEKKNSKYNMNYDRVKRRGIKKLDVKLFLNV